MTRLILLSLLFFPMGALSALAVPHRRLASRMSVAACLLGCVIGAIPLTFVLVTGRGLEFSFPWNVPYGSFALGLDPLSAFFLIPIFLLSSLAAVYGYGYLASHPRGRRVNGSWFFFNLLVLGMVLVVLARNGILFLVSWELMSLASFFLVTFEYEKESVRRAGWLYLVATHLGTVCLIVFFLLLGRSMGSMEFLGGKTAAGGPFFLSVLFLLAVAGFGAKAGFVPFHVWLPEAHPAAPSHVSALMSGVMIKTGIYGLARILLLLGPPQIWWGILFIALGVVSGILGVLFALSQHDLKRLLAYHSVENIGIIFLGFGLGLLGLAVKIPALSVLGFSGGLLHVLNHSLFKGLLFFGAGAVLHASRTAEMDRLGGLLKRLPWTGALFLVGAAAISGLPPLNGFVSEFLIYLGSLYGFLKGNTETLVAVFAAIASLALIGGLAAACFAKAFAVVFLGEPRSEAARQGHEVSVLLILPMAVLAALCAGIGLFAPFVFQGTVSVLKEMKTLFNFDIQPVVSNTFSVLSAITGCFWGFLILLSVFFWVRHCLLKRRPIQTAVTWDCGYLRPTSRMQYTSSSFAEPLTRFFSRLLCLRRNEKLPEGLFPQDAFFHAESRDIFMEKLFTPIFRTAGVFLNRLRWIQHGRLAYYILYIALALIAVLLWKL